MMKDAHQCVIVGIAGVPNVGKSTLVNAIVGTKISIVSPKVQTTRNRLRAIAMRGKCQIILMDTPGIFVPKHTLEHAIVQEAWQGIQEVEQLLVVVDASKPVDSRLLAVLEQLHSYQRATSLVLNKVDLLKDRSVLLQRSQQLHEAYPFERTFMVSAQKQEGVEDIAQYLAAHAPQQPWLFPEDQLCDMPMRFLAAEITREQLFLQLQEELPYAVMVQTEQWQENAKGEPVIHQCIFVLRDNQKAIVLGKQGSRIKQISQRARSAISQALDVKVHLYLHVKVKENWTENPSLYQEMSLAFPTM